MPECRAIIISWIKEFAAALVSIIKAKLYNIYPACLQHHQAQSEQSKYMLPEFTSGLCCSNLRQAALVNFCSQQTFHAQADGGGSRLVVCRISQMA
jgi:hypothetical protein